MPGLKRTVTIEGPARSTRMRYSRAYRNPKVETRYKNTTIAHAGTDESNTLVNALVAGDGTENRSGRKALCKTWQARIASTAGTGPTQTLTIRVVLYSPKVAGTTLTGLNGNNIAGSIDNDQFWVIYDRVHISPRGDDNASSRLAINLNLRRMLTTEFSGTGGTDITRGDVYLYLGTEGSGNIVVGHTKVWFQDK